MIYKARGLLLRRVSWRKARRDRPEDAMEGMSMADGLTLDPARRQRAAREGLIDPRRVAVGLGPTPVTGALHRQVIQGTDRQVA